MTISYPLAFPTTRVEASASLTYEPVVGISESKFTRQQTTIQHDGDRWILNLAVDQMDRESAAAWMAFLGALRGFIGTFMWGPKLATTVRGTGAGTPLVNGGSQAGSYQLVTDGFGASQTVLKQGDFFQIDNNLYMAVEDVNSDGSGNATIEVIPKLRVHSDNSALLLTNPQGIFRLASNATPIYVANRNKAFTASVTAMEAR